MHGREGERKRGSVRHMWTEPTRASYPVVVASSDVDNNSCNSFYKDGRKISVGDCALFKPPQDSPPFIGIIRWLSSGKENNLRLGVNWLYRPAEVKLGKGILLEAAPNEVFYSFHKDETSVASLLHRCKVAFLPKGVELPSGISSFVCRRVYDITNKCLWWLTDQDYINERQEEVDQLLYKSRIEMHATVQPGGRSPKTINGPTSTSQLKPGSDSVQNSPSFPSQVKVKKRERADQGSEPVKRERVSKSDDGDSGHCKTESFWKSEISKFTEKGGLVDSLGVEKLVNLILPERNEKKIDLVGRSILAGVVAATEKVDCLNRFVQLRGLPVFDEWLQEAHKGKIGDISSPKDGDKSVEECLFVLLRALDKLPINLHALQTCNIGKSVNHLRSHKNLEIQKKARSLVDTWKKRVEAEMDAKAGSNQGVHWPARSRVPEVSHGGSRHSGISSDVAIKSSAVQLSTSKPAPVKLVQGDPMVKSASASPASVKSVPSPATVALNLKEGQFRGTGVGGASDLPQTATRDEKSSSPSQSHNNSHSCSSEHAKTLGKEDSRSSTAGSATTNKGVVGSLRQRKSVNGFLGAVISGVQKEMGSARSSSSHRDPVSEKLSQPSLGCEKAVDVPMAEGNGHKLIVKISSRGRSPVQSANGGSRKDLSVINSRASSPVLPDKHNQFDRNLKEKNDALRCNVASEINPELWSGNDFKEMLNGSDEVDGTVPEEDRFRTGEDSRKISESAKPSYSSSGIEHEFGKMHEASYSSLNTFIENCVKYSEANASLSAVDDVGMNLLASVAAGEMSKTDVGSPNVSPQITTPIEHSCVGSDSRVNSSPDIDLTCHQIHSTDADDELQKQGMVGGTSLGKSTDGKPFLISYEKQTAEHIGHSNSSNMDVEQTAEHCLESKVKSAATSSGFLEKASNGGSAEQWEEKAGARLIADTPHNREEFSSSALAEDNANTFETKAIEGLTSCPSIEADCEKKNVNEKLNTLMQVELKPSDKAHSESVVQVNVELLQASVSSKGMSEKVEVESEKVEVKSEKTHETEGKSLSTGKAKTENITNTNSVVLDCKDKCTEDSKRNAVKEQQTGELGSCKASPALVQESEQKLKSKGAKLIGIEADEAEECASAPADTSGSNTESKVEFDLNEGFNSDDGKYGEPNNLRPPTCPSSVPLLNPLPVPASSVSGGLPASVTVASAAKRPFVPPEDLLKNKGELGWKGSAATSAFRPAEPRKVLEMQAGTANSSLPDAVGGKPSRLLLDIDLNVPDERVLEDLACRSSNQVTGSSCGIENNSDDVTGFASVRSSGGLDFDLNIVDEPADVGNHLTSSGRRFDVQLQPVKTFAAGIVNVESSMRRDFDLNDGPLVDDMCAKPSPFGQLTRNSVLPQPSVSGLGINNTEMGNFPSWFPQGNLYPSVTIPSIMSDRGEQSFPIVAPGGHPRMLAPTTGTSPFGSTDVYRGAVLTSSPAVPFMSTPFQYPVFPFGTSFPIPSASFSGGSTTYVDSSSGGRFCFPAVHSQVLAPSGAGPSHYPRPYVVSLTDSGNNGSAENSRKWGRQGLDLNAGPAGIDVEGRDETSSLASRQLSVASSQPTLAEEQSRMYHLGGGGVPKRKEPEGGWDGYKQTSWQ